MRIKVDLWDNTERDVLKFGVSVEESTGDEFVAVARISFKDGENSVPETRREDWEKAEDAVMSGELNRVMAGTGYYPGDRERVLHDIFGILKIPETKDGEMLIFNLSLWKAEEFYDVVFNLDRPSEWMTLAQKDAGMIGMWMSAAEENLTDGFYDVGHSVVPTDYDIMLDREIDREHEKQWCKENGIEW